MPVLIDLDAAKKEIRKCFDFKNPIEIVFCDYICDCLDSYIVNPTPHLFLNGIVDRLNFENEVEQIQRKGSNREKFDD